VSAALGCGWLLGALQAGSAPAPELRVVQHLALVGGAAVLEVVPTAEDGPELLLWIDRAGRVASLGDRAGSLAPLPAETEWQLPHPARTLVCAGVLPDGSTGLLTLSPEGATAYRLGADHTFLPAGRRLSRRARFDLRVGAPRWSPFLVDLDGDGQNEVLQPEVGAVSLWRFAPEAEPGEGSAPAWLLERSLRIEQAPRLRRQTDQNDLTDRLSGGFELPGLRTEDLNGDGRADLVVVAGAQHAFHLCRADGSLPAEPDTVLDLTLFRDPDAPAGGDLRPGGTLTTASGASLTLRDLDGDRIQDAVITSGRKVWVFPGRTSGPQFTEPSAILRSGEDVTRAFVVGIDGDGRPDLVLVRIEVPSIATLVLGLISEWDVVLEASGYRNVGAGKFEVRPAWDGEVRVRLPAILDLVGDPYTLLRRFQEVGREYREALSADLDGDGTSDAVLVTEDRLGVEVWLGADAAAAELTVEQVDQMVADVLFHDPARIWTLERILSFLELQGSDRVARVTAGRSPTAALTLVTEPLVQTLEGLLACDPDGDGRDVLVGRLAHPDGDVSLRVIEVAR
jgi:hypothetical protein